MDSLRLQYPGIEKPPNLKPSARYATASLRLQKAMKEKDTLLDRILTLEDQLDKANTGLVAATIEHQAVAADFHKMEKDLAEINGLPEQPAFDFEGLATLAEDQAEAKLVAGAKAQ